MNETTKDVPLLVFKNEDMANDFGFLNKIQVKKSNEELFMSVDGKLVNSGYEMSESEFVKDWLWQFAVGLVGDKRYFDLTSWFEITNNGKLSVVIKDDKDPNKTLFVIKPIVDVNLNQNEIKNMKAVGMYLSRTALTPDVQLRSKLFRNGIDFLSENIKSERKELHDFIPMEFFEKHKVYPWVCKAVIYIRDTFGYAPDSKALGVIQSVLTKYYLKEKLSKKEIEFLEKATGGILELDFGYTPEVKETTMETGYLNPDEC